MAEDKDSDDFLKNGAQLHEHPEWQSLDDILLILWVKYGEWRLPLSRRYELRLGEYAEEKLTLSVNFHKGLADYLRNNPSTAPSEAAKVKTFHETQAQVETMVFCGHPYSAFWAIPPILLCLQFSQFVIDLDSCIPSNQDIGLFHKLCQDMSDIFDDEFNRNGRFIMLMKEYGFSNLNRGYIGHYPCDGQLKVFISKANWDAVYCILKVKNKIPNVTLEPMAQAIFYWLEAVHIMTRGKDNQFLSKTNFPAVLLLHYSESCSTCLFIYFTFSTGPYISITLTVYTGIANVQMMTPVFPLHFYPSDARAQATGERFICALHWLLFNLKNYYLMAAFSEHLLLQPQFPFYNRYTNGITAHQFVYEKQIDLKRAFIAHLEDNLEDKIFVKFTLCYGEDVHETAYAYGFAPRLRAVEHFADGWVMVVIDDISHQYCWMQKPLKKKIYQAAEKALVLLHKNGYVHGDVRKTNIMVKRDGVNSEGLGEIILVDFDWAGKENTVWYPSNIMLNHPDILRPESVEHEGLISSAHDVEMLRLLS